MKPALFKVFWSSQAKEMLRAISDRVQSKIYERVEKLTLEPEKQGKPLQDDLSGYYSIRAVGQRYRVIYKIHKREVLVFIVAVGLRKAQSKKDIYSLAQKMVRLNLL